MTTTVRMAKKPFNFAPRVLPTSITTAWCLWPTYFFFLLSLEKCARNILYQQNSQSHLSHNVKSILHVDPAGQKPNTINLDLVKSMDEDYL